MALLSRADLPVIPRRTARLGEPCYDLPLPGESLISLVRRTAAAMGYERLAWSLRALPVCREHRSGRLGRYAGGHLSCKVCLFHRPEDRQLLHDRAWITQTEAATVLKLRTGAIPQLIQQGILTGQVQPAGNRGRSVGLVLRESVENLQRDLQSAVGVAEAATQLGTGRAAVRDLIHEGVLARVVRTQRSWRIPVSSLSTLEALLQQPPTSEPLGVRWLPLSF